MWSSPQRTGGWTLLRRFRRPKRNGGGQSGTGPEATEHARVQPRAPRSQPGGRQSAPASNPRRQQSAPRPTQAGDERRSARQRPTQAGDERRSARQRPIRAATNDEARPRPTRGGDKARVRVQPGRRQSAPVSRPVQRRSARRRPNPGDDEARARADPDAGMQKPRTGSRRGASTVGQAGATARERRIVSTYSTSEMRTFFVDSRLRASQLTTGTSLEIARASRTSCALWYCMPSKQLIATR
jgi:hypothetical protein